MLLKIGRINACLSAKLNGAQGSFYGSERERELLALLRALEEWRHYFLGKKVILIPDHKCDTCLQQEGDFRPGSARWAHSLAELDIERFWRPRYTHVADLHSRVIGRTA